MGTTPLHPENGASAPAKPLRKAKRPLTPGNFFRTVANVLASGPVLLAALVRPKTSAALREKVMLGSLTGNTVDAMLGRTVSPHQDRKTESS